MPAVRVHQAPRPQATCCLEKCGCLGHRGAVAQPPASRPWQQQLLLQHQLQDPSQCAQLRLRGKFLRESLLQLLATVMKRSQNVISPHPVAVPAPPAEMSSSAAVLQRQPARQKPASECACGVPVAALRKQACTALQASLYRGCQALLDYIVVRSSVRSKVHHVAVRSAQLKQAR